MRYAIVLAPEAVEDLRALPAAARAEIRSALETYLRHVPTKLSRSRIKRLRGVSRPQYRLRVNEIRVFYDVEAANRVVNVIQILSKADAIDFLKENP